MLFKPTLPVVFYECVEAKEKVISWEMSYLRRLTYFRELVTRVGPAASAHDLSLMAHKIDGIRAFHHSMYSIS